MCWVSGVSGAWMLTDVGGRAAARRARALLARRRAPPRPRPPRGGGCCRENDLHPERPRATGRQPGRCSASPMMPSVLPCRPIPSRKNMSQDQRWPASTSRWPSPRRRGRVQGCGRGPRGRRSRRQDTAILVTPTRTRGSRASMPMLSSPPPPSSGPTARLQSSSVGDAVGSPGSCKVGSTASAPATDSSRLPPRSSGRSVRRDPDVRRLQSSSIAGVGMRRVTTIRGLPVTAGSLR